MRGDWHSGPPPHIGWWEASRFIEPGIWRWWDGTCWSLGASPSDSAELASVLAKCKDRTCAEVEWTHNYPENARVPRVAIQEECSAGPRMPKLPIESLCCCAKSMPRAIIKHDDKEALREVLTFVEMTEYCFPVSAQPVLGFLRQCLGTRPTAAAGQKETEG